VIAAKKLQEGKEIKRGRAARAQPRWHFFQPRKSPAILRFAGLFSLALSREVSDAYFARYIF
jgi:hypothetical protein